MKHDRSLVILSVEGSRGDHNSFTEDLRQKGYEVFKASSGSKGLKLLDEVHPNVVVVDAASLRTSGVRICQSFRKADSETPIILIVENDISIPDDIDANLTLHLPFTVQKLINRMCAYQPTDDKYMLRVGPIALNLQTQLVTSNGAQTRLTPRLVKILEMLIEHQGEVVQRDPLFKTVWETDYTGDTRTLDVHISWLRQAVEEDPKHPRFIKTVRGVGYKLDA